MRKSRFSEEQIIAILKPRRQARRSLTSAASTLGSRGAIVAAQDAPRRVYP
jgi:hypothetical protein